MEIKSPQPTSHSKAPTLLSSPCLLKFYPISKAHLKGSPPRTRCHNYILKRKRLQGTWDAMGAYSRSHLHTHPIRPPGHLPQVTSLEEADPVQKSRDSWYPSTGVLRS